MINRYVKTSDLLDEWTQSMFDTVNFDLAYRDYLQNISLKFIVTISSQLSPTDFEKFDKLRHDLQNINQQIRETLVKIKTYDTGALLENDDLFIIKSRQLISLFDDKQLIKRQIDLITNSNKFENITINPENL